MTDDRRRQRRGRPSPALLLLLGVALVLGGAGAVLPTGVFWHSDEGAKFLQMVNLRLGSGGLQTAIRYPGRDLDPALRFVPFHPKQHRIDSAGQIELQWPIFLPLLAWPFYQALGWLGLAVLPLAGALGACWLSYRLARAVGAPPAWAALAIPLLGLGTPLGFYSWVFFEHTLAAAGVAGAVLLAVQGAPTGDRRRLGAAGLVLGAAIYLRSELYLLAVALGVVAVGALLLAGRRRPPDPAGAHRQRVAGGWGLGGRRRGLAPLWAGYMLAEGGPLPLHATWYFESADPAGPSTAPAAGPRLPEFRYLAGAGAGLFPDFLAGPATPDGPPLAPWQRAAILLGTLAALVAGPLPGLARGLARLRRPRPAILPPGPPTGATRRQPPDARLQPGLLAIGLAGIGAGALPALVDPQPYGSLHGFVLAAPIVVLAAAGWDRGGRAPAAWRLLGAITTLYLVFHLGVISALSGLGPISRYEWGQRYLLPAYPLLVALAVAALARLAAGAGPNRGRPAVPPAPAARPPRAAGLILVLAAGLALLGAGFLARGWLALHAGKEDAAGWGAAVAAAPDRAVLTDRWWLPLVLAPQFPARAWLLAPDAASAAAWPAQAARDRLPGFSIATISPTLGLRLAAARPPARPGAAQTRAGLTVQHFDLPP